MISFILIQKIFIRPRKAWQSIAEETHGLKALTVRVLLPLLMIPATASFLGWVLIGKSTSGEFFVLVEKGWRLGIEYGLVYFFSTLTALLFGALLLTKFTPAFRGVENLSATFRLLVYAWIPALLSGVFLIIPVLYWMQLPFMLYSFVLIRLGAGPITDIPAPARTVYAVTAAFIITSMLALSFLITRGVLKLVYFS